MTGSDNFKLTKEKILFSDLQILCSAICFGIGFLGQRVVMIDGLGVMTCNTFRFGFSAILLVLFMPWLENNPYLNNSNHNSHGSLANDKYESDDNDSKPHLHPLAIHTKQASDSTYVLNMLFGNNIANCLINSRRTVLFWGIFLGFINFGASGFQQWGISLTSASKVAFIAGFDLFLTPMLALFIPTFKRNGKPTPSTWLAVSMSLMGLYLLSNASINDLEIGLGETLTLISTFFWTLHITYTDIATNYINVMQMMCVQFTVVTLLSGITAFLIEPQSWFWHHLLLFVPWLIFLAITEGLGFLLMALGQSFSPPSHAAIILSLEGVVATIASYLFLGEILSHRDFLGCALMLAATFIAKIGCGGCEKIFDRNSKSLSIAGNIDLEHSVDTRDGNSNMNSILPSGSPMTVSSSSNGKMTTWQNMRDWMIHQSHSHSLLNSNNSSIAAIKSNGESSKQNGIDK
eukprot:gene8295-11226_t